MNENGKPKVLIVDDEEDFRTIFSEKLAQADFATLTAKDGNEALEKARAAKPDFILMDIRMPNGPDGIETALSLKNDPETKDIKLAFLSSLSDPWPGMVGGKGDVSRELGAEEFFPKTVDLDELATRIKQLLATN